MDWQKILFSIIGIVLTALMSWVCKHVNTKIDTEVSNEKYAQSIKNVLAIVVDAVKITYQTYVEDLKEKDAFTPEAQKEALERATDEALAQLGTDAKTFISTNFGDVEEWIKGKIEAVLYDLKNKR